MTVSIQFVSDLHIDINQNYIWCRQNLKPCADILVVAGDTCSYNYKNRVKFIRSVFLPRWKTIIEVPGNHDHYKLSVDWKFASEADEGHRSFVSEDNRAFEKPHNHSYLHNYYKDINVDNRTIRFICSTLWSKIVYNCHGIIRGMNDYRVIKGYTVDINNQRHEECVRWLDKTLTDAPDDFTCIVVTHHLPLMSLIDSEYTHNSLNEAYATDLYPLVTKHMGKIKVWAMGHCHKFRYDQESGIHFIRNPLGYPPELTGEKRTFDPAFKIDV